jgi:hypothetical protein
MTDSEASTPEPPLEAAREHAEFRLRDSPSAIGAAVTRSYFEDGTQCWECLVTDGERWHYVMVLGSDIGPFPDIEPETVEDVIERFAAEFPEGARWQAVLDANPMHIDRAGVLRD